MKLGLGTAQFGMSYGISNRRGKISANEVRAILAIAESNGVDILDTAAAYGDSEAVIGSALTAGHAFQIVTKSPPLNMPQITRESASLLKRNLARSLQNLRQDEVYGFLLHDARDLFVPGGELLIKELQQLKREGLVRKVGVSVYTSAEIDTIMSLFVPDIIQAPVNIFDQRLLVSGHLAHLKNEGVEIHARSVFLQGLLLMEPDSAPDFCAPIAGHFARYVHFLKQSDLTKLEAALAFIAQEKHIDVALVGVSSSHDFEEIIAAINHNCSRDVRIPNASDWAVHDEAIINPAMWPMGSPS